MSDIFNYLVISVCLISGYTLLVSIFNVFYFKKPKLLKPKSNKKISIIVPCRNEEKNIVKCVDSLLEQDYNNIEIILVDDNSSDRTWFLINNLSKNNKNIKAIKGQPLPNNWRGKNWACHQGFNSTRGNYLLFMDADTKLTKFAVSSGINQLENDNLEFLSLVPNRKINNIVDFFIWSMVSFFIFSWIPLYLAKKSPYSFFAAGFGQYLLFTRESYEKIDGHNSIKNLLLDDFELARRIKHVGFNSSIFNGTDLVETEGYSTSANAIDGHGKVIFAAFRYNILIFLFAFSGLLLIFYLPFLNLFSFILGIELYDRHLFFSFMSVIFMFLTCFISTKSFSLPIRSPFLYPISMIVLLFSGYRSFLSSFDGQIEWKGRSTPVINFNKIYRIIFFPIFVLYWVYRKIR